MRIKALLLLVTSSTVTFGTLLAQVAAPTESITRTVPPGFCLLANNLNHPGGNNLNSVLPNVPIESQVLKFSNNSYHADIFDGTMWLDALTGEPSGTAVSPGEGFFFFNPTAQDLEITFTGEAPRGIITIPLRPGFSLVGSPVPRTITLVPTNGFPHVLEMQIVRFDCATQRYRVIIGGPCGFGIDTICWYDGNTGDPVDPTIPPGEGFFIFNPRATVLSWVRNWTP